MRVAQADEFIHTFSNVNNAAFNDATFQVRIQPVWNNTTEISRSFTMTGTFLGCEHTGGAGWSHLGVSTPYSGGGSTTVPAGTEYDAGTYSTIQIRIRRSGTGAASNQFQASWRFDTAWNGEAVSSFLVVMQGTVTITGATASTQVSPELCDPQFPTGGPLNQIWYQFLAANESGEERELKIIGLVDAVPVELRTIPVPDTEGPHPFEGSLLAAAESFTLLHEGGELVEGVGSFSIEDSPPWQAGVLFSGLAPENIKVRLDVDVFSEVDQTITVKDTHGEIVGTMNVPAGAYSATLDFEFVGSPGQELSFEASDGDYTFTLDNSASVDGGGIVNVVGGTLHRADDIPEVTSVQQIDTIRNGQVVTEEIKTVGNSVGQFIAGRDPDRPFNPVTGFSSGYSVSTSGGSTDTLARIDAQLGSFASGVLGPTPIPSGAEGELEDTVDGFASALSDLPRPGNLTVGRDTVWNIALPTINGFDVPDISIDLSDPAIGWIRLFLLVATSLFWLFATVQFLKT